LSPNIARQQGDSLGGQRGCAETPFSCVVVTWVSMEAISRHAILRRNRLNALSVARFHMQVCRRPAAKADGRKTLLDRPTARGRCDA